MLGIALRTCTPSRWTSSGRRDNASCTRFCVRFSAEQRRRTGCSAAAGDEVANRDQVCADAAGERRRDATMLEIELGVTDLCLRVVHGGQCGLAVGRAVVDRLFRTERFSG